MKKHAHRELGRCALLLLYEGAGRKRTPGMGQRAALLPYGKNLVDGGVPLDQVATLLGHESLDTTRIYTRPSKSDLEWAVRRAAGEV